MASWQAYALDFACRLMVKSKLKRATDLAQARAAFSGGGPAPKLPAGTRIIAETLGGVPGEWVRNDATPADAPVLLYLHGGGYFACSPLTHRPLTSYFAKSGFAVFAPDYRLAPEHPFPAALDDAAAVIAALRAQGVPAARLCVAGDSAGGGLSAALLLRLRDAGEKLPAAACLFSPWTDLAGTGESLAANTRADAMLWGPGMSLGASFYAGDADLRNPLLSPLYGDLTGLPPLLIHVGAREILLDDARRFATKAGQAGVRVELRVWPVVPHVWQLAHAMVPEGRDSLRRAAEFLREACA